MALGGQGELAPPPLMAVSRPPLCVHGVIDHCDAHEILPYLQRLAVKCCVHLADLLRATQEEAVSAWLSGCILGGQPGNQLVMASGG